MSGPDGQRVERPVIDRRQFLARGLGAAGVVALGGLVAACGGDDSDPGGGTPQRGGTLRVGTSDAVAANYFRGDSLGTSDASIVQFAYPLFIGAPDRVALEYGLAESYEAAEDGRTHTITLRPGLTFHDGSPCDAEAVAENLRSGFFPDHPLRDQGAYRAQATFFGEPTIVTSVDVVDEVTLQIALASPIADIRDGLYLGNPIMNPAILAREDYGTDASALRDAGSGPFRVTSFEPGSYIEFERFDGFYEEVLLDALRMENVTDPAARALALRAGDIDVASGLSKADHDALASDGNFQAVIAASPTMNVFFWFAWQRQPATADRRVREAIALAMNREAYREAFFHAGTAQPSTQAVAHPDRLGYNDAIEERPYDPDRARALLDEAGVTDLRLSLAGVESTTVTPEERAMLEAMASDLGEVGIDVDVVISDPATVYAQYRDHDGFIISLGPAAESTTFPLVYAPPPGMDAFPANDPRSDPEVGRLLGDALATPDLEERDRLLQELQMLEHEELVVTIPLALVSRSVIARAGVQGLTVSPAELDSYHRVWVEGGGQR
ncbi:MAG TPA: ABC transporter substrate-binding protein [Acidimicrobiales bacterium]